MPTCSTGVPTPEERHQNAENYPDVIKSNNLFSSVHIYNRQFTIYYLYIKPAVYKELRSLYAKPNTELVKQTFVWLGRFKLKEQVETSFFLFCMVLERNKYTERCYENGLKPKLPQATYLDTCRVVF